MKESEFIYNAGRFAKAGLVITAGVFLASNAFSRAVRRQIWDRAGGVSELSGRSDWPRECAHYDHDRDNPDYNNPDNGILLLRNEHYMQHVDYEGSNGLDEDGNQWALEQIWDRMTEVERQEVLSKGYPPPTGNWQLSLL